MSKRSFRMRAGTVHGVKHAKMNLNNQDASGHQQFSVRKKTYRVGIVSDGCTGIPAFSRTEVGANLLVVFCMVRIQELLCGGVKVADVPLSLYPAVTNFLRGLTHLIVPAKTFWPYPMEFKGSHEFRNQADAATRFKIDYLSATIVGFIDDGETLVTFQAGDGVIIVNDKVLIVDQDDRPDYPAGSIDTPSNGFDVKVYPSLEISRLVVATDGIEELLEFPEAGLPEALFVHESRSVMGLQMLLNILRRKYPEKVSDDLTVVTREVYLDGEDE